MMVDIAHSYILDQLTVIGVKLEINLSWDI